jgi:hypothetical protein
MIQAFRTIKSGSTIPWGKLDRMMRDAGVAQFSKETFVKNFKLLKDTDPIKKRLKFDPKGVTVKDPNEPDASSTGNADTVSKMAKRATKIGG